MISGVRPVCDVSHVTVFDGVEMHVVHMGEVVFVVADDVFPVSALPDASFMSCQLRCASMFRGGNASRECAFDQPPAPGVVSIPGGEFNDAVKMLRQNHPRVDMKGVALPDGRHASLERINMLGQKLIFMSSLQGDSEEIGATRQPHTSIVHE